MKVYLIKIKHIATGSIYVQPVLAHSEKEAKEKATMHPYGNDGYIAI